MSSIVNTATTILPSAFILLSVFVFAIGTLFMFQKQITSHAIILIALINVIAAITSQYFPEDTLHTGIIRAVVMFGSFAYYLPKLKIDSTTKVIIVYLSYLLIIVTFSSNVESTFSTYLKHGIGLLMFPIAYQYFKDLNNIKALAYLVVISLALINANLIVAQFFHIGRVVYGGSIYVGGGRMGQTYLIAYFLLSIPLILLFKLRERLKLLLFIVYPLSIMFLFLVGRRGSILGFLAGLFVYSLFTYRKSKAMTALSTMVLVGIIAFSVYAEQINFVQDRIMSISEPEDIARYQEVFWSMELIQEKGITHALFGSELFNYQAITGGRRGLHMDYTTLLIGSGVLGLLLYLSIYYTLFKQIIRIAAKIKSNKMRREIYATFFSLITCAAIISISGQYGSISSLALLFIIFGSILGITFALAEQDYSGIFVNKSAPLHK